MAAWCELRLNPGDELPIVEVRAIDGSTFSIRGGLHRDAWALDWLGTRLDNIVQVGGCAMILKAVMRDAGRFGMLILHPTAAPPAPTAESSVK